jgi:hypothetical protein
MSADTRMAVPRPTGACRYFTVTDLARSRST